MTDHRALLTAFLRTDLLRAESLLERCAWSEPVAQRVAEYVLYATLVQRRYLEGALLVSPPAAESAATADEALSGLEARTDSLLAAIAALDESTLHETIADPHGRDLTLLGHLYDLCRASATLIGWLSAQPTREEPSLDEWFDEPLP